LKVCPIHGEVTKDDIVSGYEFAPNQYVIIDDDEVDKAIPDAKGIELSSFIPPAAVDPTYYEGRVYYLAPDGSPGAAPFALLREAMQEEQRWGFGEAVLWGKNRQLIIRPVDGLLAMSFMQYGSQVRQPKELEDRVPDVKIKADELKLARQLISATSESRIEWAKRQDEQGDAMRKLIEAKVAGKQVVIEEDDEPRPVINIVEALKKSLRGDTRRGKGPKNVKADKRNDKKTMRHMVAAHRLRRSS
jgi:DNA end-binding protein Ku